MVRGETGRYSLQSRILLRNIKYFNQTKQKTGKSLVNQAYIWYKPVTKYKVLQSNQTENRQIFS